LIPTRVAIAVSLLLNSGPAKAEPVIWLFVQHHARLSPRQRAWAPF